MRRAPATSAAGAPTCRSAMVLSGWPSRLLPMAVCKRPGTSRRDNMHLCIQEGTVAQCPPAAPALVYSRTVHTQEPGAAAISVNGLLRRYHANVTLAC